MSEPNYDAGYLSRERWLSFVQQLFALIDLKPSSVLEVGVGPGVMSSMIAVTYPGCSYTGLDLDAALNPQVSGDARALPFADGTFDAAFCCQVLEHLPYPDFLTALDELRRVSRRRVVISLPDVRPFIFLRARPPSSRRFLPWLWRGISLPALPPRRHQFEAHGQHYWEIGKRGFPFRRIRRDIGSLGWAHIRDFRMVERNYWHFIVLDKTP